MHTHTHVHTHTHTHTHTCTHACTHTHTHTHTRMHTHTHTHAHTHTHTHAHTHTHTQASHALTTHSKVKGKGEVKTKNARFIDWAKSQLKQKYQFVSTCNRDHCESWAILYPSFPPSRTMRSFALLKGC